jgi:plastocyanin
MRAIRYSVLFLFAAAAACGGDDSGDGGDDGSGSAATCDAGVTAVAVTATSATPACTRVPAGTTVTFTNAGMQTVEIRSAPHPTHGSCPELDTAPVLAAGESFEATMTTQGTCQYHDHLTATGVALGRIEVTAPTTGTPTGNPTSPTGNPGGGY